MNCKNCNHLLSEADKFCPICGNKTGIEKLTVKNLLLEIYQKIFSLDNKFFVTVKHLVTRPENVIKSYLDGNRVKYMPPINFLIIAGLFGGFFSYLMLNGYMGEIDYKSFDLTERDPKNPIANKVPMITEMVMKTMQQYYTLILFLTIPLISLISKIVFYDLKKYNFAEHIIIYSYGYSAFLILSYLMLPFLLIFKNTFVTYSYFTIPLIILYHIYLLKRFFELNIKTIIIKTLFFLVVGFLFYIIFSLLAGIIIVFYLISTGQFTA